MVSTAIKKVIAHEKIAPEIMRETVSPVFYAFSPATPTNTPLIYFMEITDRYSGMDFDYYRKAMTTQAFRSYLGFIGEEKLVDFLQSDFEVPYPEDEE